MSEPAAYEYAIIRIVPNEARGEFINAGVLLYCAAQRFLQVRSVFEPARLTALAPQIDLAHVQAHLTAIEKICAGGAGAGALGSLSLAERFRWLTAPHNTLIQTSPVHAGLTTNPAQTLHHLFETLVELSP